MHLGNDLKNQYSPGGAEKGVLEHFAKITEKHMCWGIF